MFLVVLSCWPVAQRPRVVAIRRLKTGARIHFSWPSLIAITVASLVVACIDQDVCSRLRALAFDSSLFSFSATFVLRRVVVVAAAVAALPSRADSEKSRLLRDQLCRSERKSFFFLSLADAIHLETFTVQLGPHLNNSFIMKLIFHCASIFCAVCSCGRLHNLLVLMQWKSFISCGHTRFQRLERPARNIPRHDVDLPLRPFHFSSPPSISLPALLFYLR